MEANVFDNINGHLLKELNEIKKTVIYITLNIKFQAFLLK